jgi:hypothetical protein
LDFAFQEIVDIFNESFPNVTIQLKSFPAMEYSLQIQSSYEKDSLPVLFESSGIDKNVLNNTQSVSKAVAMVDKSKILFFGDYNKYFPKNNQFPLGFIAPAIYTNTSPHGNASSGESERQKFLAGETAKYDGTTADFEDVQNALPGLYTISPVLGQEVLCEFSELWSIGQCDEDQLKAAQRLLAFFLSDNAQDFLHIRYQSNSLPLNRETLKIFSQDVYSEFSDFFKNVDGYTFNK